MNRKIGRILAAIIILTAIVVPRCLADVDDEDATLVLKGSEEEEDDEEELISTNDEISQKVKNLEIEGNNYLQKVMKQLENDKYHDEIEEIPDPSQLYPHKFPDDSYNGPFVTPSYNISGPTPVSEIEAEYSPEALPLSLTKEELTALYEAAAIKASQLNTLPFDEGPKPEDEPSTTWEPTKTLVKPAHQGGPVSGYYYYYFPIKSFITGENAKGVSATFPPSILPTKASSTTSHQHLHATVTMIEAPNKAIEPLFMAVTSFIGMALMLLFSVVLVPQFHKPKNSQFHEDEAEMGTLGQIILEAMAGRDCAERLACEFTRIFRGIKSDNKTLRILEILLPPGLSNQIFHIRKAADRRGKCGYIACKGRKVIRHSTTPEVTTPTTTTIKTYKLRPWKDKDTAHELWMSHFDKNKHPYNHRNRYYIVKRP